MDVEIMISFYWALRRANIQAEMDFFMVVTKISPVLLEQKYSCGAHPYYFHMSPGIKKPAEFFC